jgi:hypothetical protein
MEVARGKGDFEKPEKEVLTMKHVSVRLVGGLGNQLFGYFAGKYLAEKLSTEMVLDDSQLIHNKHVNSNIFDFLLDEKVRADHGKVRLSQVLDRIPVRSAFLDDIYSRYLSIHYSREIGYDPNLEKILNGVTLVGYYQSYRYFFGLTKQLEKPRLLLKSPGDWFKGMQEQAALEKPIIVHVRRGDYSKPANQEFGLLARDYYLNGISLLRSVLGLENSEVWVFSDSLEQVVEEFGPVGKDYRFIDSDPQSSAAENLVLMSSGGGVVTSNSTFSYWSGLFSQHQNVIAPSKWFQSRPDPFDLVPPTWTTQESIWK